MVSFTNPQPGFWGFFRTKVGKSDKQYLPVVIICSPMLRHSGEYGMDLDIQ
jgi:hypothetical protein